MFSKKFLNISDFAKLSGVSRQTLIYYDRIGLFSPSFIAENKYRMYAHNQIDIICTITILKDLGVPLKKIKQIIKNKSPETSIKILNYQLNAIQEQIEKFTALKNMTQMRLEQIVKGHTLFEQLPLFNVIQEDKDVPFYIGEQINCVQSLIEDDDIDVFFKGIEKNKIPLIFAFGYIKTNENVMAGNNEMVSRMCFRLNDEKYANAFMQSGKYIVAYAKGDYGKSGYIYNAILQYAAENGFTLTGDFYEEYLIDELAEVNPENYVFQVSVRIR